MKKSFKRAGVAVLSMAMLLSMGAVGLTANAAEGDAKTIVVSQIKAEGSQGDNIISKVEVYQVAKQDSNTNVWSWNSPFATVDSKTFEQLQSVDAELANKLARSLASTVKTKPSNVSKYKVATKEATTEDGKITAANIEATIGNNDAEDGAKVTGTGYYLVIPTSSDAGVVLQPSLVQITSSGAQKTTVATKGTPLPFDKAIESTTDGDTADSGDTSVGVVGSTVNYSITTQLPTYADNVNKEKVKDFVIEDDPSSGILINTSDFSSTGSNVVVKFGDTTVLEGEIAKNLGSVDKNADGALPSADKKIDIKSGTTFDSNDGFTITIPGYIVAKNSGATVTVTFTARVDTDAKLGTDTVSDYDTKHNNATGNPNTAHLTYGNNYATGGYADPDGEEDKDTPPDESKKDSTVTTYVGKVLLEKVSQSTPATKLNGAEFQLYKEEQAVTATNSYKIWHSVTDNKDVYTDGTKYYVVGESKTETTTEVTISDPDTDLTAVMVYNPKEKYTTAKIDDVDGQINFGYLAAGNYKLIETKAPSNYQPFGLEYTFTVTTDTDTNGEYDTYKVSSEASISTVTLTKVDTTKEGGATLKIQDPDANTLPGTGGMGTVLFTVGGAAIVLAAGAMFVVYMRKRKTEE